MEIEKRTDQYCAGFAAAQGDSHALIDTHCQRIPAWKTLMQHFNARAFDETHFEQAALDVAFITDGMVGNAQRHNAPYIATAQQAQGLGGTLSGCAILLQGLGAVESVHRAFHLQREVKLRRSG